MYYLCIHSRTEEEDLCEKDVQQGRGHSHAHKCLEEVLYEGISFMFSFFLFDQWNSMFVQLHDVTDNKSGSRIMLK